MYLEDVLNDHVKSHDSCLLYFFISTVCKSTFCHVLLPLHKMKVYFKLFYCVESRWCCMQDEKLKPT